MNRQQRRAAKKRKPPRPQNKFKADQKTVNLFYDYYRLLAMTVLHDKFGFGKRRLTDFEQQWNDLNDSVVRDFVSIMDLNEQLANETGIRIYEQANYKRQGANSGKGDGKR